MRRDIRQVDRESRLTPRAVELRHLAAAVAQGRVYRFVGRFHGCRRLYSAVRGGWQRLRTGDDGARDGADATASLFDPLCIDDCTRALHRDGLYFGFNLPRPIVSEIYAYAWSSPCTRPGRRERFVYRDVTNGRTSDGRRVAIADVVAPSQSPAVARVAADRRLRATVSRCLGYQPGHVATRLFWSPRTRLADDERRRLGQTIDFHYDIENFNAIYAYFYITPTDSRSGAHVVVKTSHRRKPARMILSSCFQPASQVLGHYGRDRAVIIEGPAGFGFLEAPQCFHRALPPAEADRLLLQIRYS